MAAKSRIRRHTAPRRPEVTRRLPLGSLRVFMAVAECRSFTLAADALGVSVSATSMQVRSLEQYLGLPLFRRDGRLVEPTAEALQLLPRIRDGLSTLQQAIDETRVARGSGTLYISTLPSFLLQWLSPRLPDFLAQHPEINLRVEASSIPVDFNTTGITASVRFGDGNWPALHAEKVLDEWLVPVCRPDLLKKFGPVNGHEDLTRYHLLHSTTEPWSNWLSGLPANCWPETGMGFDDSAAVVRLAASGKGLALARWSLIADELGRGELALASKRITSFARRYYFVCSPKMRGLKKVAAFRDWLINQAASFPVPP
jgi:LysR family transcriptional regulator, glycine cleavage system transcriptional activator